VSGRRLSVASIAAASIALLLCTSPAPAAVYKPTRFDDPTPGKCRAKDCSLREAISATNKRDGNDKVKLAKGRYELEIPENVGDNNKGGDLDVIDKVTIAGRGPRQTTVDGNGLSGVFALLTFPAKTVKGMTVTGGNNPEAGGGFILSPSKYTLRDLIIKKNEAPTGGGIYSVASPLKLQRSTVTGNTAAGEGGGIQFPTGFYPTSASIHASTISGNTAGVGAGISADGFNHDGLDEEPVVNVVNSTFANNKALVSGGGVSSILAATVTLHNSTVTYNRADSDDSGGGAGGGVYQSTGAGLTMIDSILAANDVGSTGAGPECGGVINGSAVAVEGQGAGPCTFAVSPYATIDPGDRRLGPLAANGGPTKTVKLLAGSIALGFANTCPKTDQRGVKRPADCDAGAYERKGP
jgi:hypothetical protein